LDLKCDILVSQSLLSKSTCTATARGEAPLVAKHSAEIVDLIGRAVVGL
jgi:hypothetical protein